jgi:endo-1,4-beta-D-glucanase Y/4-amino-4-deoxy-L-arabinose transferase-like glycosyltransferase
MKSLKVLFRSPDILIVLGLLIIAGLAHGINMFHYPYFENDEATYASQAYSFIRHGKLAPYTYYYDHAPAGWMFMGFWFFLTGYSHLFGSILNSGRVFMLVLHLASCVLVYYISKKLTNHRLSGIVAVLLFSLSPLGIYFQRRILLDNIMIFWVLMSLGLLLHSMKLRFVALSALCFGIAVLSKENAIFFYPVFLLLIYRSGFKKSRLHALYGWLAISLVVVALYFLYALLKGELFPTGSLLGGTHPHVSLLTTLDQQLGRGKLYYPWQKQSEFYQNMQEWIGRDPLLMISGMVATVLGIVLSIKVRSVRVLTSMVVLFWIFLARGKLVVDLYIIPLLPLLAMLDGAIVVLPFKWIRKRPLRIIYGLIIICLIGFVYLHEATKQYTRNETSNQLQAVAWIEKNVPRNSYIVMDNYAYPYLHDQAVNYPHADYFAKFELDPAVRKSYNGRWQNIQYLLLTDQILYQIRDGDAPDLKAALDHSTLVASFTKNTTSYLKVSQYISTNGDWAQVYKIKSPIAIAQQDAWDAYKTKFVHSYGQVINPVGPVTTSEGQGYGLLRAYSNDDKSAFAGIYAWTKDHMEYRKGDSLFSWKWVLKNGKWVQADSNTATDGDEDIAYSLLEAGQTWHNKTYTTAAQKIIKDIWRKEVVKRGSGYYLASSALGANAAGQVLINPSYIDPAYYAAFTKVDPTDNWNGLITTSYTYLSSIQDKTTGMVPDWAMVNALGQNIPLSVPGLDANFGYDAFRFGYRLSGDLTDPRTQALLKPLAAFYASQWQTNHSIAAIYATAGQSISSYSDVPQYGVAAVVLKEFGYSADASSIFNQELSRAYKNNFWGNSNNYYTQNWAAFSFDTYQTGQVL